MSRFTFDAENKTPLEVYEWDNVWFEHAEDPEHPRVLYIGDSISCGTRHQATIAAGGKIYFDGIGTSKAVDNPYLADSIRLYAAQQGRRELVIFNNGLHGFHLSDDMEYARYYEDTVKFLTEEFAKTPIALVLSTTVREEKTAKRVIARNNVVLSVADKYNLPIIDLHTVSVARLGEIDEDGVHFGTAGYMPFAEVIVKRVQEIAPKLKD